MAYTRIPLTRVPLVSATAAPTPVASKSFRHKYPKGHPKAGKFMSAADLPPKTTVTTTQVVPARAAIIAYKGFNKEPNGTLSCRGTTFKVGEALELKETSYQKVRACYFGFHACENPFNMFEYYRLEPGKAYGQVELRAPFSKESDKVAGLGITVLEELSWPHLMNTLAKFAKENPDNKYVKANVQLNGIKPTRGTLWDINTRAYCIQSQVNIDNSTVRQFSDVPRAKQINFGGGIQMAFGDFSHQIGHGWQVSHGHNITTEQLGPNYVEVHGKDSQVILHDARAKVKGIAGTRITVLNPGQCSQVYTKPKSISAVIGENGLEPDKWIWVYDATKPNQRHFALENI